MNNPKISKLFNLKNWLKLPEAAKHLSIFFGEEITEADIFRLALDKHLTLSVDFVNGTYAKPGKVVYFDEDELNKLISEGNYPPELKFVDMPFENDKKLMLSLRIGNGKFITFENRVEEITGIWDLPMIGGEQLDVEHEYQLLTQGPEVTSVYIDGAFVSRTNQIIYQLQENYENNEYARGSNADLKKLQEWILINKVTKEKEKKLLTNYQENRKKFLEERDSKPFSKRFFPAGGLPDDYTFVIRTDALREFERYISEIELEENSDGANGTEKSTLSDTERNNLLKQVGGLALVLAEKNKRYKKGETPSANAIAESVIEIIESLPDSNKYGLGKSNIRQSISEGLKLLIK